MSGTYRQLHHPEHLSQSFLERRMLQITMLVDITLWKKVVDWSFFTNFIYQDLQSIQLRKSTIGTIGSVKAQLARYVCCHM